MLLDNLGDGVHCIARAVSCPCTSLDLDGTCTVEAANLRRSRRELRLEQGIKRNHAALRVLNKDKLRCLCLGAIVHVGL